MFKANSFFTSITLALGAILTAFSAHAASDRLLAITSEGRNPGSLSLILDGAGQISGLQVRGLDEVGEAPRDPRFISYNSLANGSPLFETRGYTVMEVELESGFNKVSGGPITLTYYTNVLTHARVRVPMELARSSTGDWSLRRSGQALSSASIDVGSFGIDTIAWGTSGATNDYGLIRDSLQELTRPQLDSPATGVALAAASTRVVKPALEASSDSSPSRVGEGAHAQASGQVAI